jgi:hypothetical protein
MNGVFGQNLEFLNAKPGGKISNHWSLKDKVYLDIYHQVGTRLHDVLCSKLSPSVLYLISHS